MWWTELWDMWKVFSYFSPGVFYSRFLMQIGNLHHLKKYIFFLFGIPFVPLVAFVLSKELIFHLPSTTCSSLLCGHDVHGPLHPLCLWRGAPTPCCGTTGGGLSGTLCCCGATQHCGQRGSKGQGSFDPLLWLGRHLCVHLGFPQIFEIQESG